MGSDWLADLADYLQAQGIGTVASVNASGWGIFTDGRPGPQKADKLVILTRTGGTQPHPSIPGIRRYTVQVKAIPEKTDQDAGRQKTQAVYEILAGAVGVTQGGRTFDFFKAIQQPTFIGYSETGDAEYVVNFELQTREEVT